MRWELVAELGDGSMIAVVYAGHIPPGSLGNPMSGRFIDYLQNVLQETHPAAVMLDLIDVDYTFGDAICGLALAILRSAPQRSWRMPVAIVAAGRTAAALAPLLEPNWAFGIIGAKMFADRGMAEAYLKTALRTRSAAGQAE
jgi:hypothetical protein